MWVRIPQWMIGDSEPPRPRRGQTLRSWAIRVGVSRADLAVADHAAGDNAIRATGASEPGQPAHVYEITGTAGVARDVWIGDGGPGEPERVAGSEFVLTVGDHLIYVTFHGRACEVVPGARVTVTGALDLIAEYELDAFELEDTRADWHVGQVVIDPNGDVWADLTRAAGASDGGLAST